MTDTGILTWVIVPAGVICCSVLLVYLGRDWAKIQVIKERQSLLDTMVMLSKQTDLLMSALLSDPAPSSKFIKISAFRPNVIEYLIPLYHVKSQIVNPESFDFVRQLSSAADISLLSERTTGLLNMTRKISREINVFKWAEFGNLK